MVFINFIYMGWHVKKPYDFSMTVIFFYCNIYSIIRKREENTWFIDMQLSICLCNIIIIDLVILTLRSNYCYWLGDHTYSEEPPEY